MKVLGARKILEGRPSEFLSDLGCISEEGLKTWSKKKKGVFPKGVKRKTHDRRTRRSMWGKKDLQPGWFKGLSWGESVERKRTKGVR